MPSGFMLADVFKMHAGRCLQDACWAMSSSIHDIEHNSFDTSIVLFAGQIKVVGNMLKFTSIKAILLAHP